MVIQEEETMKKTIIFAAAAALITFASCQKEETQIQDHNDDLVFTASIAGNATRTTINAATGKIAWEPGDEITITDQSSVSVRYVVSKIDATSGKARFTKKSGETGIIGDGPYTALYGTDPATAQTYSADAPALPMSAVSSTTELTFTVTCGLLEVELTAADGETTKDIRKVEIMGTPAGGAATIYTLDCSEAQSISSAKKFYMALPVGSYSMMKLTNSTGHISYKTAQSAMTISTNTIQPTSVDGIEFNDMLPGKFSVASGKQVQFSKGNLRYTLANTTWSFFNNQYDRGAASYFEGHHKEISLHCWGYSSTQSIVPNGSYTNNVSLKDGTLSQTEDWGCTIGDGNTWRTLTVGEWQYLINMITNATREGLYSYGVTVVGVENCVVLYPDVWTGEKATADNRTTIYANASDWAVAEASGAVCLSNAYTRGGSTITVGTGDWSSCYWTSSCASGSDGRVWPRFVTLNSNAAVNTSADYPSHGFCVRLITDVK